LDDINFHDEIDETASTLEGNALLKAKLFLKKQVLTALRMIVACWLML
jgi:hypothetical protein